MIRKKYLDPQIKIVLCLFVFLILACQKEKSTTLFEGFVAFEPDTISSPLYSFDKENNCLFYKSPHDTLNLELGKDRFIFLEVSEALKEDFSNKDIIENYKSLMLYDVHKNCLDTFKHLKYAVLNDVVFLPTDSIVQGQDETFTRIITLKSNLKFE